MTDRPTAAQSRLADEAIAFTRSAAVADLVTACLSPQPLVTRDEPRDEHIRVTARGLSDALIQASAEYLARTDSDLIGALRWEYGWERIRAAEQAITDLRALID